MAAPVHLKTENDVHLVDEGDYVRLENGIVKVRLSKPQGIVTGIRYASLDNLLEVLNSDINRGYWDLNWSVPNGPFIFDVILGTQYNVINESPEKVEVSFVRKYDPLSKETMVPLDIDKRWLCKLYKHWRKVHSPQVDSFKLLA
ncbi:hypothetical protein GOP47_0027098 [Adiantum capillus-veneris]|nr:hypothetical protein GOP47_0027098 [Adiantum capillus-veneris]